MHFKLCENTGFFLRLGLIGPSGSGKTYTALKVASELGYERIGIIDTENRSARRYARAFPRRFLSLELSHFSPRDYIQAMQAAQEAGIEVLIIDSLSHAWMGRGGVLEMVDQSARRQARGGSPNSFSGWREVTPEHNKLVDALVQAPMHLIVTMRVKTDYIVEKDDKGKAVPRKVGLAPVQREGLEYEFDIVGDLSPEHELLVTKSRCPRLTDVVMSRPGTELARALREWVDGAEAAAPSAPSSIEEAPAEEAAGEAAADTAEPGPEPLTLAPSVDSDRDGSATAITADLPPVRPALPRRPAGGGGGDELGTITPWLKKIQDAEELGSEEQLDAVREEMNKALRKRTKSQGEVLRRAIESARAAIQARGTAPGQAREAV